MAKSVLHPGLARPAAWLPAFVLTAIALCMTPPLHAQTGKPANVSGDWIAVFGDSVSAGTLALHLREDSSGAVSGKYRTTLGGEGIAVGKVEGNRLSLTLAQTEAQCPGSYQGSVTLANGAGEGTFTGHDCLGTHNHGVISIHRRGTVAVPPPTVPHDAQGDVEPYTMFYENGQPFWIARSESAFLAVAGSEVGGYFRLTVLVGNASGEPVTFFPSAIQVTDLNRRKTLHYLSPAKIARRIEHRGMFAAVLMAFGNGLQAYSNSMVTIHTTGTVSAFDNQGDWAQGSYYGTTTVRRPINTARLRARNERERAMIAARVNRRVRALTRGALHSQTLAPDTYMVGNVMFPPPPKVRNMNAFVGTKFKSYYVKVLIPVGAEHFVFLFPMKLLQVREHELSRK